MRPRLFLLQPTLVFRAQINQAEFSYPIAEVAFDTVTVGSFEQVIYGQTVVFSTSIGAADLGRQRVRRPPTENTFYFGRSSRGTHDGEVDLRDDAYIEVWDDYRIWPRIPAMPVIDGEDLTTYKDHEIAVGVYTTTPPPVANIGPGYAGTIDPNTGVITVEFDASNSWAVADGASITGYQWFMYDGTITVGTDTDAAITATFPAGFRWVALTVTDSNGLTHTARCPVYARDPDNDDSISAFEITRHRITPQGQEIEVRVLEDIPQATYPDGTLALLWDDDAVTAGRSHMWLIGWHHTDPAQITSGRLGLRRDTTLELRDVAGKLDSLPGFPQVLYSDDLRDTDTHPTITWEYMVDPTIKKYLHYLLHWHSTALDLADFRFRGSTADDDYPFLALESGGASLYDQVASRAQALTPDHVLTCTRRGELAVWPDPMLIDPVERTEASQGEILEEDWTDIRYTHQRPPRVYWLRAGAILSQSSPTYNEDGSLNIPTVFCVAPGEAPGTGEIAQEENERLALSQEALNRTIGHKYARLNAPQARFSVTLADSDDRSLEPANLEWVWVGLNPEIAAQRGLSFVTFAGSIPVYWERGLVHSIDIRYDHRRTGLLRTIAVEWEREVSGTPAVTVLPPVSVTQPGTGLPDDYWEYNPGEVVLADPADPFYGHMKAYVLWDGAHVFRTWNIRDETPVWELIDSGITGDIYDGQYVHVSSSTVGMWLLTSDAVWWCADIMADTPTWDAVLSIATVRAADAVPSDGVVNFKSMFHAASEPGYLIVATGPNAGGSNLTYAHAYFWHTHDYGQSWTQVDMNQYTDTDFGNTHGYFGCGRYGLNIHRASGVIWCVRQTPRFINAGDTAVFVSEDGGHSWEMRWHVEFYSSDLVGSALLDAFPALDDPSYVMCGRYDESLTNGRLLLSTDSWATGTQRLAPTGYLRPSGRGRPNKRTYDTDHIMLWWRREADTDFELLESEDRGISWTSLYQAGSYAAGDFCIYNTPNGWPPNANEWVIVRQNLIFSLNTPPIYYTDDRFQTLQDKTGNLGSLVTNWTAGWGNGFALPRLGKNA